MESRIAGKPGPDCRRLVGAVVVHHEMDVQAGRNVGLDGAQELQELTAAVPAVQLADDLARGNVERRKERRSSTNFQLTTLARRQVDQEASQLAPLDAILVT